MMADLSAEERLRSAEARLKELECSLAEIVALQTKVNIATTSGMEQLYKLVKKVNKLK